MTRPLWTLCLVAVLGSALAHAQDKTAVRCGRLVVSGDEIVEGGVLLIDGGRIREAGADVKIPDGWRVVDRSKYTVMPGLIDVYTVAGAPNDLDESADPVDEGARAADVLDGHHRDFGLLLRAGVTSVAILPSHRNVVGGAGCVVKTGGRGQRIVTADSPVKLSMSNDAFRADRFPTSYMAARKLFRDTLERAKKGTAGAALNDLAAGKRAGICWAQTERDLAIVLGHRKRLGLERLSILGARDARKVLEAARGAGVRMAIAALDLDAAKANLLLPKEMQAAGVDVAFYNETPKGNPDRLRISAALAARHGLAPAAAVDSITRVPAEMAGVAERVGSLAAGRDADFVVLDRGPLDLSGRIREVWVGGRRVHKHNPHAEGH